MNLIPEPKCAIPNKCAVAKTNNKVRKTNSYGYKFLTALDFLSTISKRKLIKLKQLIIN